MELLVILSNFILNCSVFHYHAFHYISLQKLEHQFSGATYRSSQRTLPQENLQFENTYRWKLVIFKIWNKSAFTGRNIISNQVS